MKTRLIRIARTLGLSGYLISTCVQSSPASRPVRTYSIPESERLEVAVSCAEAVVIADFDGLRETVVDRPGEQATQLQSHTEAVLSHVRVLKGDVHNSQIQVVLPPYGASPGRLSATLSARAGRVVAFLTRPAGAWMLEVINAPNAGVLPIARGTEEAVASRIETILADQTLATIARRSPLIVAGHLTSLSNCTVAGTPVACHTIAIDSIIAGRVTAGAIVITTRFTLVQPFGRALFFVRPSSAGTYELVGFNAGVVPTHNLKGDVIVPGLPEYLNNVRTLYEQGGSTR